MPSCHPNDLSSSGRIDDVDHRAASRRHPGPKSMQRLAYENDNWRGVRRGHNGEYFGRVHALLHTEGNLGFTFERGFDATLVTKLDCPAEISRDFLRSVKRKASVEL
jgi:hypothetical protein